MGRPRKRPTLDEFILNVKKRLELGQIDEKQAENEYLKFTRAQDALEDLRYYHKERPTARTLQGSSKEGYDIDGQLITFNKGKSRTNRIIIEQQEYGDNAHEMGRF